MKLELELPDGLVGELQQTANATREPIQQIVTQALTSWLNKSRAKDTPMLPVGVHELPPEKRQLLDELLFDGGACLVSAEEMKRLAYE
jgi:hypothetical protein